VGFELTTSMVIGTDCTGSCKSNYHTITATTAPVDIGGIVDNHFHKTITICNMSILL